MNAKQEPYLEKPGDVRTHALCDPQRLSSLSSCGSDEQPQEGAQSKLETFRTQPGSTSDDPARRKALRLPMEPSNTCVPSGLASTVY